MFPTNPMGNKVYAGHAFVRSVTLAYDAFVTEEETGAAARRTARRFVVVACLVVAVESIAFVVLGVLALLEAGGSNTGSDIGIGVFLTAYGAAQLYACRRLLVWQAGARSPLVLTQLILLGLAWGLRDSDRPWHAYVMAIAGVIALAGLLHPAVTRVLSDDDMV